MKPPLLQSLKLKQIEIADLQARAATDDKTIDEYAEAYIAGEKFPPAVVFHDGKSYFLADGFHRYFGADKAGFNDLLCDVRNGTRKDALWFAVGANRTHGLKRSPADKRHAAELALRERPELADRAIADHVGISATLVSEIRVLLVRAVEIPNPPVRVGSDGKHRPAPPLPPVPQSKPKPTPPLPPPPVVVSKPPVVKPSAPAIPQKFEVLDRTGHPIPDRVLPLWERGEEMSSLLTTLSGIRGTLRKAEEEKDKVFAEVSFGSVQAELDRAFTELKTIRPHAVCTACKGFTPDNCTLCRGKGYISEFRWNTVPKETKELRAKTLKK